MLPTPPVKTARTIIDRTPRISPISASGILALISLISASFSGIMAMAMAAHAKRDERALHPTDHH